MKFAITKGKQKSAIRLCCYGSEGIGKSTFASQFPEPLFIDIEGGTKQLDVARLPQPETWGDLIEEIDAVIEDPECCQTLVIDTVDRAEAYLITQILKESNKSSIEDFGYGKGFTILSERFQKDFLNRLDRLIAKGVNVVLLAHAQMRKFESPDEPAYDRWELKTSKKVAPLVKEWTDILTFINYDVTVVEIDGRAKAKGKAKRTLYFTHTPTHDAKNRFGLPDSAPLSFDILKKVYEGSVPKRKEHTMLNLDTPTDGIVEGVIEEDVRDVLIRRLEALSVPKDDFEEWLRVTGRIAPEGSYMDLSGTSAEAMLNNIEILARQIKEDKR